jgi:hypothetical protein
LSADVGDLQFGHGQAEMFYGSRATGASVADKPACCSTPRTGNQSRSLAPRTCHGCTRG